MDRRQASSSSSTVRASARAFGTIDGHDARYAFDPSGCWRRRLEQPETSASKAVRRVRHSRDQVAGRYCLLSETLIGEPISRSRMQTAVGRLLWADRDRRYGSWRRRLRRPKRNPRTCAITQGRCPQAATCGATAADLTNREMFTHSQSIYPCADAHRRREAEAGGVGVAVVARDVPTNNDPHPQPLPTRGRGAHRVRGSGDRVQRDAV